MEDLPKQQATCSSDKEGYRCVNGTYSRMPVCPLSNDLPLRSCSRSLWNSMKKLSDSMANQGLDNAEAFAFSNVCYLAGTAVGPESCAALTREKTEQGWLHRRWLSKGLQDHKRPQRHPAPAAKLDWERTRQSRGAARRNALPSPKPLALTPQDARLSRERAEAQHNSCTLER